MRLKILAAAAALALAAAPALGQSSSAPPMTPDAPSGVSPAPPMSGAPGTTTTESTTTTTTTTTTSPPDPAMTPANGCHTRKSVGATCSCLSAPTTFGTAVDDPDSTRNFCQIES